MIEPTMAQRIAAAQEITHETIAGAKHERVKYGDDFPGAAGQCSDCGVARGQYHVLTCCVERCPACRAQATSCRCTSLAGGLAK